MLNKKLMTRALVLGTAVAMSGSTIAGVVPMVNTGMVALAAVQPEGEVSQSETMTESVTIEAGKTLTIKKDVTLTIPDTGDIKLTVNGTLVIEEGAKLEVGNKDYLVKDSAGKIQNKGTVNFPSSTIVTEINTKGIDNIDNGVINVDGTSVTPKLTKAPTLVSNQVYNDADIVLIDELGSASNGTVKYGFAEGSITIENAADVKKKAVGDYDVWYQVVGDPTGSFVNLAPVKLGTVKITKTELEVEKVEITAKDYDGTRNIGSADIAVTYKNGYTAASLDSNATVVAQYRDENVGKDKVVDYKITLSGDAAGIYSNVEIKGTTKGDINKATPTIDTTGWDTGKTDLKYTGEPQELINPLKAKVDSEVVDIPILYSQDASTWSTEIPKGEDVKSYTILYKIEGNENYENVDFATLTNSIGKADSIPTDIVKTYSTYITDEAGKTVEVQFPKLPKGISWDKESIISGNPKVKAEMDDNGKVTLTVNEAIGNTTPFNVEIPLKSDNYTIGASDKITIAVTPTANKTQTIDANNIELEYGDVNKFVGATVNGKPGAQAQYELASGAEAFFTIDPDGKINIIKATDAPKKVTIKVTGDSEYEPVQRDIYVTVKKKPITVKIKNQEITVGQELPDLKDGFEIVGTPIAGERFKTGLPVLEYNSADKDVVGVYDIQVSSTKELVIEEDKETSPTDKTSNYEVTVEKGKLTVKAEDLNTQKKKQNISFANGTAPSVSKDTEFFMNTASGTVGTVTYTSSEESVATVDNTGKVTIKGIVGQTTIKLHATGNGDYDAADASYILTVTDGSVDPSTDISVSVNPTSYVASVGESNVKFTAIVTGKDNVSGYEIKFKPVGGNYFVNLPTGAKFNEATDFSWITLSFDSVASAHFGEYRLTVINKYGTAKNKTVTMTLSQKNSGGGGSTGGGSSYSGGGSSSSSGSGSLSRPPVTTPNGSTTAVISNPNNNQNNQTTNNDTPAGSNVPVSSYAHPNAGKASQIIRLLNPASGEHIITTNVGEAEALVAEHGWKREAVAGTSSNANNSPVFRMFHAASGKHIYSMNAKEIAALVAQGWTNEGVLFFAGGKNVIMYRLFNSNLPVAVAHHYTTELTEYEALGQQGWQQEGEAFRLD